MGHVYEQFLGKVIRLTKSHQAKVEEKPEVRKAGGVYYTPTYVAEYIIDGQARYIRALCIPALENVALWHERDISHSSVERMIGPDATITLDFALARLTGVVDKLVVYPDNMLANMNKFRGLVHSQRVLLALTQAGVSREDAYRLVQRNAMKVWEEGKDFLTELKADAEVTAALSEAELEDKFDLGYHTKHVDTIFARVFGD